MINVTTDRIIVKSIGEHYVNFAGLVIPVGTECETITRDDICDDDLRKAIVRQFDYINNWGDYVVIRLRYEGVSLCQIVGKHQIEEKQYRPRVESFDVVEVMAGWKWYLVNNDDDQMRLGTVWWAPPIDGKSYCWWILGNGLECLRELTLEAAITSAWRKYNQ